MEFIHPLIKISHGVRKVVDGVVSYTTTDDCNAAEVELLRRCEGRYTIRAAVCD